MQIFKGKNVWDKQNLILCKDEWNHFLSDKVKAFVLNNIKNIRKPATEISIDDLILKDVEDLRYFKTCLLEQLENGHGFIFIKGLNVVCRSKDDYEKALWIIGLLIGKALPQSKEGDYDFIHEVKDRKYKKDDTRYRGTTGTDSICFHNDACDVAALLCINDAKKGGENKIVSSGMINNFMYYNHKDLLEELYKEYPFAQNVVMNTTPKPFHYRPIIASVDNKLVCTTIRALIDKSQVYEDAKMTVKQVEALDLFEELAHKFSYEFKMERGDLVLFNNFITLHSRNGFVDNPPPDSRLLLRLWLYVENSRNIHPSYKEAFGSIKGGDNRGGHRL